MVFIRKALLGVGLSVIGLITPMLVAVLAQRPNILVDPFARGVNPANIEATFDNCIMYFLASTPELPYRWLDYACDDVVGYHFILTYLPDSGQRQVRERDYRQMTNRRTEIYSTTHIESGTVTHGPGDSEDWEDTWLFEVIGYLKCAEPELLVIPDKVEVPVGETVPVRVRFDCEGEGNSTDIRLSLSGPRRP